MFNYIFVGIYFLIAGRILFYKTKKEQSYISYILMLFSAVLWQWTIANEFDVNATHIIFWARASFIGPAIMMPSLLYLSWSYPNKQIKFSALKILLLIIIPAIVIGASFSSIIVKSVNLNRHAVYGWGHKVYAIFIFSYIVTIIRLLLRQIRRTQGEQRLKLQYFFMSLVSVGVLGTFTNLVFPLCGSNQLSQIGPYTVSLFVLALAYVLPRRVLMDFTLFALTLSATLMTWLIYTSVFFILHQAVHVISLRQVSVSLEYGILIYGIVICMTYRWLNTQCKKLLNRTLFKKSYNYQKIALHITQELGANSNVEDVAKTITNIFQKIFKIKVINFFVNKQDWQAEPEEQAWLRLDEKNSQFVEISELENKQIMLLLQQNQNKVTEEEQNKITIRCMSEKGKTIGILILGQKDNHTAYTIEDIKLITGIQLQLELTLIRIKPYEKLVHEYEKSMALTQEISKQAAYAALTVNIAHEIYRPLLLIKSGIDFLLKERQNREKVLSYIEQIKQQIMRLSKLTTTALKYGKIQSTERHKMQMNKILEEIILLATAECEKRNIRIHYHHEAVPELAADEDQLSQVFLNMILNAIEAINQNGDIYIHLNKNFFTDETGEIREAIQIDIQDSGEGIPKEKLDQIFDKFYSTRENRYGLGLAFSKKIIEEHHGKIEVKSKVKLGTRFTVFLPTD